MNQPGIPAIHAILKACPGGAAQIGSDDVCQSEREPVYHGASRFARSCQASVKGKAR